MTIRVSHIPEPFADLTTEADQLGTSTPTAASGPLCRIVGGSTRYINGQEAAETTTAAHYALAGHGEGTTTSIAGTLNATYGPPTVDIPGFGRTRVEVAEKMGLVRREGDRWVDVVGPDGQPAAIAEQQQEQEEQRDPGAGVFDSQDDADWIADIEPLPQHAYDAGLASTIAHLAHGTGSVEGTAKALAEASGIEPSLALQYVEQGIAMYERTADRALLPLLGTAERVAAFRAELQSRPGIFQDAVQSLVYGRDPSRLVELAKEWRRSNQPDTSFYKAAGFEVSMDPIDGATLVRMPGGNWQRADKL